MLKDFNQLENPPTENGILTSPITEAKTQSVPAKNRLASFAGRYLPPLLVFVLLLVIWQGYVQVSGIKQTILPGPLRVITALTDYWDVIWDNTLYTLYETVIGFTVALLAGFGFAVLLDSSSWLRRAFYPLLIASQTVPLVAIAPLLIIWFGYTLIPKIIVVWLVCFFPIVVAGVDGFAATDPEITRLFKSLQASRWQIFWKLRFPSALPFLFSGLRIAITYSVAGAIFGEYVGAEKGLGIFIQHQKNNFRNDLIFAAVLVTAVISVLLFLLVSLLQHRVMPWYYRMRENHHTN